MKSRYYGLIKVTIKRIYSYRIFSVYVLSQQNIKTKLFEIDQQLWENATNLFLLLFSFTL